MRLKKIENISNNGVTVQMEDGNSIYLAPKSVAENINVKDITGIQKYLKVLYDLGEIRPFNKRLQLRD